MCLRCSKVAHTYSPAFPTSNRPFPRLVSALHDFTFFDFNVFGELKYVRLPKKVDGAHRGFGFVDFVTINDAEVNFKQI